MAEAVYFVVLIIVLLIIQYNQYVIEKRLNSEMLELHILLKQIYTLTKEQQSKDMRSEILQKMMENDENDGIYE